MRPGASVCGQAVEPDFFVRDMLTWAVTRHPAAGSVPLVPAELRSPVPQARSQALHTLSKIGDGSAWPSVTDDLLRDAEPEVARAAWRAAVALVPAGQEEALAGRLVPQLGLVRPRGRTSAGYREYGDADLHRILHVEALRSLGLSLAQVGHALDGDDADGPAPGHDPGSRHAVALAGTPVPPAALARAGPRCPRRGRDECRRCSALGRASRY